MSKQAISEVLQTARMCYEADAEEFLRENGLLSSGKSLQELAQTWDSYVRTLFDKNHPERFYESWVDSVGAANIAANISDQFSRTYVFAALDLIFEDARGFTGTMLDYGCGTAAVSLTWQRLFAPRMRLVLADVDNLARKFLEFQQRKYEEDRILLEDISLSHIPDNSVDLVLCIDVLEHLRNPSQTFNLLERKLRTGGFLILQAPWLGHPEHLEEAPVEWKACGGETQLNRKFLLLAHMNPLVALSGVFVKKIC